MAECYRDLCRRPSTGTQTNTTRILSDGKAMRMMSVNNRCEPRCFHSLEKQLSMASKLPQLRR